MDGIAGDKPFILHADGVAWLYVTSGLKDGPLPTHYEPLESPFGNALYPEHATNPPVDKKIRPDNNYAYLGDERFPFVLTTYRLTEHHTAGGMSRQLPHLAELQPELFCEVSPELAADRELRTRRLGDDHDSARNGPGARAGHPAHASAVGGRANRSPGWASLSLGLQRPGERRCRQRSAGDLRGAERPHHGNQGAGMRHRARKARARPAALSNGRNTWSSRHEHNNCIFDRLDVMHRLQSLRSRLQGMERHCRRRLQLDRDSYDNTGSVGHSTWRHVKFVEHAPEPGFGGNDPDLASWVFSSDVCKHCEEAGCLEACPTGAIVRTEFGGVFVQPDICNGCSYCVVACPFGVVQRNKEDGRAFKCTFCYDRQKVGLHPACSTACPTESIKFGPIDEMQTGRARARRGAAGPRHGRCLRLRSDGDQRWRYSRGVHGSRRSQAIQPAARSRGPDDLQQDWMESSAVAAGLLLVGSLFAFLGSAKR